MRVEMHFNGTGKRVWNAATEVAGSLISISGVYRASVFGKNREVWMTNPRDDGGPSGMGCENADVNGYACIVESPEGRAFDASRVYSVITRAGGTIRDSKINV
ncbi:MAG: hypothetical protein ABIH92_04140 [Nanoarchaeota archaeon]